MNVKWFVWDAEKNEKLQKERGINFEMVIEEIIAGRARDLENPSQNYPGQRVYLVHLNTYPHLVPFEENVQTIRLITVIPNRKYK